MAEFTIEEFWMPRLQLSPIQLGATLNGWTASCTSLPTFQEAPLVLNEDEYGGDPNTAPIILVSAPGAVGKSTLAKEIAARTGAVYVDLANADPVGANSLSGGLVISDLYDDWQAEKTTVLLDGLDEARIRVTRAAFEAFMSDVASRAADRSIPTVIFGRTGAIEDSWLILSEDLDNIVVIEIGYFDPEASLSFAESLVKSVNPANPFGGPARDALELLLGQLRAQTDSDGDRFAGYAPVLQAVADRVSMESNPSNLISQIEKGAEPITLSSVVWAILERESAKLDSLKSELEDQTLIGKLYGPHEQLDRLVDRVYVGSVPELPSMSPRDQDTYLNALETWVPEHPFLDGGHGSSSTVFEAVICSRALRDPLARQAAINSELRKGAAANPFLAVFYIDSGQEDDTPLFIPPDVIGLIYASLRARLSLGDDASLMVEGAENAGDEGDVEELLRAEVEIVLARRDTEQPRIRQFETEQTAPLRLGAYVEDVEISVPYSSVEIGPGTESVLVAPVSIQCATLRLSAERLVAECASGKIANAVSLVAGEFDGPITASVPSTRGEVALSVSWPGAQSHPWTSFATEPVPELDPEVDEALRRFRKFVVSFRSHSRGSLARFQGKIEHERMVKGSGRKVLNQMMRDEILDLRSRMYYLDSNRLAEITGCTYGDCMSRQFGQRATDFVTRALNAEN